MTSNKDHEADLYCIIICGMHLNLSFLCFVLCPGIKSDVTYGLEVILYMVSLSDTEHAHKISEHLNRM